jgi:hypothetical protein
MRICLGMKPKLEIGAFFMVMLYVKMKRDSAGIRTEFVCNSENYHGNRLIVYCARQRFFRVPVK